MFNKETPFSPNYTLISTETVSGTHDGNDHTTLMHAWMSEEEEEIFNDPLLQEGLYLTPNIDPTQENINHGILQLDIEKASIVLNGIYLKKGSTFNPTFIQEDDILQQESILREYFETIKQQSIDYKEPIDKTFILADYLHWSCCQIKCELTNNIPNLMIFFLDPIQGNLFNAKLRKKFVAIAQEIFGQDCTQSYFSNRSMQKSGVGCKIFAIMFSRMIHSILYGKFKQQFPEYNFWQEIKSNAMLPDKEIKDHPTAKVVFDIPAKLQQADQFSSDPAYSQQHPEKIVQSSGKTLAQALEENTESTRVQDKIKFWNNKIALESQKFSKFLEQNPGSTIATKFLYQNLLSIPHKNKRTKMNN